MVKKGTGLKVLKTVMNWTIVFLCLFTIALETRGEGNTSPTTTDSLPTPPAATINAPSIITGSPSLTVSKAPSTAQPETPSATTKPSSPHPKAATVSTPAKPWSASSRPASAKAQIASKPLAPKVSTVPTPAKPQSTGSLPASAKPQSASKPIPPKVATVPASAKHQIASKPTHSKVAISTKPRIASILSASAKHQVASHTIATNHQFSKQKKLLLASHPAPIQIAAATSRLNENDLESLRPQDIVTDEERNKEELVVARVISVRTTSTPPTRTNQDAGAPETQRVKAVIMEGRLKGSELELANELSENPTSNMYVKPGQELVLALANASGTRLVPSIVDIHRMPVLIWMSALFLLTLVVFGGQEGLKRMVALACTLTVASLVVLPLALSGLNPMVLTLLLSMLSCSAFILLLHGTSKVSIAAVSGTICGIIATAICSQIAVCMLPLSGLTSQPSHLLRSMLLIHTPDFYRDILTSGIIFGISGAVIAVTTSMSQFAQKQSNSNPSMTAMQLYSAALLTGRDFMGKMTCAVLLLSAGGALPLVLLATQMPYSELLNMDLTATIITSSISGCFGILASVPVTAIVCARIMPTRKR